MIRTSTKAVASIRGEAPELTLFPRVQRNGRYWNAPGGISLTRGTGFLGQELVARPLACRGDEPIYLLIRGRDKSEVHRRFFSLCNYLYFDCGGKPLRFVPPYTQTNKKLGVFFDYLIDCKKFDDSATRAALRGTGLQCPPGSKTIWAG
jgi:hypothetical protein